MSDKESEPNSKIKPSSALIPASSSTPIREENDVQLNTVNDTTRSTDNSVATTSVAGPATPRKALRNAITAAIQPPQSDIKCSAKCKKE